MARRPALGFIFLTLVIDLLGIGLVIPILPKLIKQLSGNEVASGAWTYGSIVALYGLMQFIFSPVLGALSDRFGRRPVILIALLGAGLDYFLLAFAPTLWLFFVARAIAGITGANISAATAYIADVSTPEKRAANFGLVGAAFGLGFAIGPALGGILGDDSKVFTIGSTMPDELGLFPFSFHGDIRLPFIVAGVLTLVNFCYGYFVLPESLPMERRRKFEWRRANPIGSIRRLASHRLLLGLAIAYLLYQFGHQVYQSTWALYTEYRFRWSTTDIGISLAFVGIMTTIVQGLITRRLIPKIGERKATLIGIAINATAFLLYAFAPTGKLVYGVIMFGALGHIAYPAIQGIMSKMVADDEQGELQGGLQSLYSISSVIGPLLHTGIFGYFVTNRASDTYPRAPIEKTTQIEFPGAPFIMAMIFMSTALWITWRSFRQTPEEAGESEVGKELEEPQAAEQLGVLEEGNGSPS